MLLQNNEYKSECGHRIIVVRENELQVLLNQITPRTEAAKQVTMMKTEALDHVIDVLNTKEPTARNFEEVFQPFGYTVEHENKILF